MSAQQRSSFSKLSADAPAWYPSTFVDEAATKARPVIKPPSAAEEAKQEPVSPVMQSSNELTTLGEDISSMFREGKDTKNTSTPDDPGSAPAPMVLHEAKLDVAGRSASSQGDGLEVSQTIAVVECRVTPDEQLSSRAPASRSVKAITSLESGSGTEALQASNDSGRDRGGAPGSRTYVPRAEVTAPYSESIPEDESDNLSPGEDESTFSDRDGDLLVAAAVKEAASTTPERVCEPVQGLVTEEMENFQAMPETTTAEDSATVGALPARGASVGANVGRSVNNTALRAAPAELTIAQDCPRAELTEAASDGIGSGTGSSKTPPPPVAAPGDTAVAIATSESEVKANDGEIETKTSFTGNSSTDIKRKEGKTRGTNDNENGSEDSTYVASDPTDSGESELGDATPDGCSSTAGNKFTRRQLWGLGVAALGAVVLVVGLSRRRRTG